ncbi:MAG: hypothetical protein CVU56_10550 [Deltaproteobacteria bacterium HGW-Deltaproteobacteria-14]|jgi:hypothetical protein|nr:MAG: hypothetical protein CVU56_10550 [Deltaproteobacteria bacterium HGW-Deltaproteobacteria-14]
MNRQIALAYAIAGLAVAVALIVIVGTTGGLFGGSDPAPEVIAEAAPGALTAPLAPSQPLPLPASPDGAAPEIVYVDAPAAGGRRGDDDDDHERREHGGRGRKHHDDDDDD